MPIHDVGYRGWNGKKTPLWTRWWIITKTGVRLALKSNWVKRSVFAAWLPLLYWGVMFLMVENAMLADFSKTTSQGRIQQIQDTIQDSEGKSAEEIVESIQVEIGTVTDEVETRAKNKMVAEVIGNGLSGIPQADKVLEAMKSDDKHVIRREIWRWLLMTFFRYPQALLIIFLIGAVAPSLIARDVRSRAFLLYFSKPIGRLEYIFGKFMTPAIFMAAVTTLPALALFMLAVLVSPDLTVLYSTWDIPLRIIAATVALVVPTCLLALALSSLTQESRFANFSWFAVWLLGQGAHFAVRIATAIRVGDSPFSPEVSNSASVRGWSAVSLYNCLGEVQAFIFGFEPLSEVWIGMTMLIVISCVSTFILYRRVSSPISA